MKGRLRRVGGRGRGLRQSTQLPGRGLIPLGGGANGGAFYWVAGALSASALILGAILVVVSAVAASGFLVFLGIILGVLVAFLGVLNILSALFYGNEYQKGCFYGALFLSVGMILGGLGVPSLPSNLVAIFGAMFPGGSVPQCWAGEG